MSQPAYDLARYVADLPNITSEESDDRRIVQRVRPLDDGSRPGYAELERGRESLVVPGRASCVLPEDIHSVWNETEKVSLSLHTYGKHINRTGRAQFDPEAKTEEIFIVTVGEPRHPDSG